MRLEGRLYIPYELERCQMMSTDVCLEAVQAPAPTRLLIESPVIGEARIGWV